MTATRARYDVCIIGGGPVGSVTAIAFAKRGARVLVLEKDSRGASRFAGEWMHPAGVEVLDALRIGRLEGASPHLGYGFVVFPGDASAPIELPYPAGVALSAPHERIVSALREAARCTSGVEVLLDTQVTSVDGHRVIAAERRNERVIEVAAERIIGADGRSSIVRRQLGFDENSASLSYMASVDLDDLELPCEGFGHVMLGGPGPVLLYRVSECRVRGCFDVPIAYGSKSRSRAFLWNAFRRVLPEAMHDTFRRGLESPTLRWATNRFRPRTYFGRGHVALVGDAVGHVHPMTAIGLSMGLLDAQSVAAHDGLEMYARERRGYVPELLSNALYHCFRRSDASAQRMRDAMFDALRSSPSKRRVTMQILSARDERTTSFGRVFLGVAAGAIGATVAGARGEEGLRSVPSALSSFREWIQWPAAAFIPSVIRETYRPRSTATHPIPFLRTLVPVANETAPSLPHDATRPGRPPSAKPRQVPPPPVNDAVAKLTELLLGKLEILGAQVGSTPDEVLAAPGLRMMRAVTSSEMRAGVAARMTIGQRWLARYGMPRVLEAAKTRDAFATSDLAELFLVLLGDVRWGKLQVVGLNDGVDALLRLQTDGGGFGVRASGVHLGEDGDVRTTALTCQALVLARKVIDATDGASGVRRIDEAIGRAVCWLLQSASADPSRAGARAVPNQTDQTIRLANTVCALEAFVSARDEASVQWVSVASRSLASILTSGELNRPGTDGVASPLLSTAFALRGLLLAASSDLDSATESRSTNRADETRRIAIETGSRLLVEQVLQRSSTPSGASADELTEWEACAEILQTLALHQALQRRGRLSRTNHGTRGSGFFRDSGGEDALPPARAPIEHDPGRARADWAFCRDRLGEVSRSFSKPIALLPEHLEVAVTLAYLLCRVADSVEDHVAVPHAARAPLMSRFLDVLHARENPATFVSAFVSALGATDATSDPELVLSVNLPVVMRVLDAQGDATRATLIRWVAEMARGMALYVFREPGADGIVALETVSDLERYCYFVAGTVGHLLTDLFLQELGDDATPELALTLRVYAESFGMGLQLVNILKDLTDDQARRWSYIPRTVCAAHRLRVADLGKAGSFAATHAALAPLFDLARGKLDDGMRYTLAIPPGYAGIRRFCLLPLWMAARTLALARGNDAMFSPGNPVKIARDEVAALAIACVTHSGDDGELRARYAALWPDTALAEERRSAG